MKNLIAAVAIIVLTGCAQQVAQFTAGDAANAAAIDPTGAACYQAIGAVAAAVGGQVNRPGVLSLVATQRAAQEALESPACAPLEAMVLGELLKGSVVAPLVP